MISTEYVLDATTNEVRRLSAPGSRPWAVVHMPSGRHVTVPVEYRPSRWTEGAYHARKRDALAALNVAIVAGEEAS